MRLIDGDALMRCIPAEEIASRMAVANAPTIEARKKGWWEKQRETYCSWSCSVCKEVVVAMPERMGYPLYDYCPNCGADMREGGEQNV